MSLKKHVSSPDTIQLGEVGIVNLTQTQQACHQGQNPIMPPIIARLSSEERNQLDRRLRRKIDLRLLPMVQIINAIAAARLAGLEEDLKLNASGTQYSTAISILFAGYIIMQVPSNLLLNKMGKPGIYLPAFMAVWGVISAATAATKSFGGLLACRFLLGFVEAAYFPGCLYYLSCWYTRQELGLRTTFMFAGSLLSGAFSGLISAAITSHMDGLGGLRAWRWLFLLEGATTVLVSGVAVFVLPNLPRTTGWLSEDEVAAATWRLERDIGQDDWVRSEEQHFAKGLSGAVRDVKTWVLATIVFGTVSAAAVTNFFPTLVQTLMFSRVKTLLLTVPPYVLGVLTMLLNAWHADRTGERFWHISLPLCLAIASFIVTALTDNVAVRYTAIVLMVPGLYCGYTTSLAWVSNTLPRPPAKRAAALALINTSSNLSSIYTSYLYPAGAAPRYKIACMHNCVVAAVAIAAAAVLRTMLARLNRKLELLERGDGKAAESVMMQQDETVEVGFRFLL